MKKLNFNFHNIDTVVGHCHQCEEESILVAIVTEKNWLREHGKT